VTREPARVVAAVGSYVGGTVGAGPGGTLRNLPHVDGSGVVIDVRPNDWIPAEDAEAARADGAPLSSSPADHSDTSLAKRGVSSRPRGAFDRLRR